MSAADHFSTQQSTIEELLSWIRKSYDADARMLQTHVSYVILHGDRAWKIKKAITLPFLDFATLALRERYCGLEVQLNQESAGDLYLGARTLYRDDALGFNLDGRGKVCEYIVEMRRFPQSALLSNRFGDGAGDDAGAGAERGMGREQLVALARCVGEFHLNCRAPTQAEAGSFAATEQEILDNFTALEGADPDAQQKTELAEVKRRTLAELHALRGLIESRSASGWVRVCHGDLHLGNLIWLDGKPVMFDRIEFSTGFSEIDVIKDLAFLYMDLVSHGQAELAALLVDVWAQTTGDYEGLRLLRLYACYRAMVRAKIASIGSAQRPDDAAERASVWQKLSLAGRFLAPEQERVSLVLMHGTTGVGKSWYAERIAGALGAVALHSDVVRKQLLGLPLLRIEDAGALQEAYSQKTTDATYGRLLAIAQSLLIERYSVVVDATFLKREVRGQFIALASQLGTQCLIVNPQCQVEEQEKRLLRRRVNAQEAPDATGVSGVSGGQRESGNWQGVSDGVSDGNSTVLAMQSDITEALDESEQAIELRIGQGEDIDLARFKAQNPILAD